MSYADRHDLKFTNEALYEELKRNHVERGQPRAQAQQQREDGGVTAVFSEMGGVREGI